MPPFLPRKRLQPTPEPEAGPTPKTRTGTRTQRKPTLFETADRSEPATSLQENRDFIDSLNGASSDSDLSISAVDSSEFEDVLPPQKKHKFAHEESEDEDAEWEDALQPQIATPASTASAPAGDLELTLAKGQNLGSLTDPHGAKKGPSKIERQIRTSTHCMHVQFLMFHNLMRNVWICDKEVQSILVKNLPADVKGRVEAWKRASGIERAVEDQITPRTKGKGRLKNGQNADDVRRQRDWGKPAVRQAVGVPDMSHGDPILKLLEILIKYWKRTFRISAPCLRKMGYKPMSVLQEEVASFHNDAHDPVEHGERIGGKKDFRRCAKKCEGSRDVGAQLFAALLRGLGIEARLVANLQPLGFGWSKSEDASNKKKKDNKDANSAIENIPVEEDADSSESESEEPQVVPKAIKPTPTRSDKEETRSPLAKRTVLFSRRQPSRGAKNSPINLSDDSSELSDAQSIASNDSSILDVTPKSIQRKPNAMHDRDLAFPTYWVEVLSPVTHKVIPVDPIVTMTIVTSEDKLAAFEPRGKKADKGKQVFAYVIAFSSDGTAKDVTTRYLKRHVWPGKTKGVRMPVEKVPIYNRRGKIKHYEQYDWFKTVLSGYRRPSHLRTAADDLEEATDLKATRHEKRPTKEGESETLQSYKQSATFVLERHLRREEALLPGKEAVKWFSPPTKKGNASATSKPEPVFLRKHVVTCRTAESWHKEGRQIKPGMQPLKKVAIRAVTLARKREVEEAERDTGEKPRQGMYSVQQTEYIIPPPIGPDGVIPRNAFGNIDCFVPTMVPRGAVHVPYRGTVRVCKKLGIEFAEAVTGFEFGNKRAVPVCQGVVVASGNEEILLEALRKDEEERAIKEEGKREKMALGTWRKFLMGLRIVERVREEYGGDGGEGKDEVNPFTNRKGANGGDVKRQGASKAKGKGGKGVIVLDDDDDDNNEEEGEDEDGQEERDDEDIEIDDEEDEDVDMAGGFVLEDEDEDEE